MTALLNFSPTESLQYGAAFLLGVTASHKTAATQIRGKLQKCFW